MESRISNMLFLRGIDSNTAGNRALALIYGSIQRQALLLSFVEAFYVIGIGLLVCTLLILLMRRSKHHGGESSTPQD
jgi:DHA2 family multidrug resistance protein